MKPCIRCGIIQPIDRFYYYTGSGRRSNTCRTCTLIRQKEYDKAHREQSRLRHAEIRRADPDSYNAMSRSNYRRHAEKYRLKARAYRDANREKVRELNRASERKRAGTRTEYHRRWRQQRKERLDNGEKT